MSIQTDAQRARVKELVDMLHEAADGTAILSRKTMADAAVYLDEYQAGILLATPHPLTRMRLEQVSQVAREGAERAA